VVHFLVWAISAAPRPKALLVAEKLLSARSLRIARRRQRI
jgi:hypothetical protein